MTTTKTMSLHIRTTSLDNNDNNEDHESPRWMGDTTSSLERLPWTTTTTMKTNLNKQLEHADDDGGYEYTATPRTSSLDNDDNEDNESPRWKDSTSLPLERHP